MRTTVPVLLLAVAVAGVGLGGCGKEQPFTPTKELASESITRDGDTWHLKFTSNIQAPVDKVYEAFMHPERLHESAPQYYLKSEVVNESGNTKTVDLVGKSDVLPPGFKVQDVRIEYTAFPDQKRIEAKSIDFKLADWNMTYVFAPSADGKGTTLTFTQVSKDKAPLIVESLQKGALREQYVRQVEVANKALGLGEIGKKPGDQG